MKRRTFRKRTPLRRRRFKRRMRRGSKRNLMQKQESAGVVKKYTTVFTPEWNAGQEESTFTISLCGGRKTAGTVGTVVTIADVNPDGQTNADMNLYQQFCIYGCKAKLFFAEPTDIDSSPVQWSCSYSPNLLINPQLAFDRMQAMASYQTGPCSQNKSISRYYALGYTKKKLGIDFDSTRNYASYGTAGGASLYNQQLPAGQGPSVHFKVFRNSTGDARKAARVQITYYVKYRGTKGQNSIA